MTWVTTWTQDNHKSWTDRFSIKPPNTMPILTNLQFWGDASDTPVGGVASWTDKSGNGNHATQGTAGKRPVCTANQQNGKNALLFTAASSQTLELPPALFTIPNGANTLYIVAKTSNNAVDAERILCGSVASANRYGMLTYNPNSYSFVNAASGAGLDSGTVTVTNYNLSVGTRSGTARTLTINGSAVTSDTNGTDIEPAEMFIGSRNDAFDFLQGGICEILLYNVLHSAAERAYNTTLLLNKWGLP
jgi:hypothetical protein